LFFKRGIKPRKNWLVYWLQPRYKNFLERNIQKRMLVLGVALAVFAFSMVVLFRMGSEFLPELEEGSILVEQVRMPSVTLEESIENANCWPHNS
jgi:cobalt-zinc-cadmium resistance protein CzcA